MADISLEAKLAPEMPLLHATSQLFFYLWVQAWDEAEATAAGDADALHDMRVALRRLRSALRNFEGSADAPLLNKRILRQFKKWRRKLGTFGDALGAVRDHDVLDEYLQDYAKKVLKAPISDSAGLAHFERYLQTERTQFFAPMVKQLNRAAKPKKTREKFGLWALGLPAIANSAITLGEAAKTIVAARLDDAFALSPALQIDEDHEDHHEFRKSLRRLRYALETLGVCFDVPLNKPLKKLVAAQDLLGEMQDRAVLEQSALACFGKAGLPEDVRVFVAFGEMRRQKLLNQTREWWQKEQTGVMQELRELVS